MDVGYTFHPEVSRKSWIKQCFMCHSSALAHVHSQQRQAEQHQYFTDLNSSLRMKAGEETSTTSEAIATRLFAAPELFCDDDNQPLSHGSKTYVSPLSLVFLKLLVVLGSGRVAAFRERVCREYTHSTRQYHRVTHKFREASLGWVGHWERCRFYDIPSEPMLQKHRTRRPSARHLFAKLKHHWRAIGVMGCDCKTEKELEH